MVDYVEQNQNIGTNSTEEKGDKTRLLTAASEGNLSVIQCLLENDKKLIKEKDISGNTLLLIAARAGHLELVQWLLTEEGGALIKEENYAGYTALLLAVREGHLSLVQWLLTEGGASTTRSISGDTPLSLAAERGHLDIVQWLVTKGRAPTLWMFGHGISSIRFDLNCLDDKIALFLYAYGKKHMLPNSHFRVTNSRRQELEDLWQKELQMAKETHSLLLSHLPLQLCNVVQSSNLLNPLLLDTTPKRSSNICFKILTDFAIRFGAIPLIAAFVTNLLLEEAAGDKLETVVNTTLAIGVTNFFFASQNKGRKDLSNSNPRHSNALSSCLNALKSALPL